jgi:hypothetical protein
MLSNFEFTLVALPSAFCSVPLTLKCGSPTDPSETFWNVAAPLAGFVFAFALVVGVVDDDDPPIKALLSWLMLCCTELISCAKMPLIPLIPLLVDPSDADADEPLLPPNQAGRTASELAAP